MAKGQEKLKDKYEVRENVDRSHEVREKRDNTVERSREASDDKAKEREQSAREEIEKATAESKDKESSSKERAEKSPYERRIASKQERRQSFDKTMTAARVHMSPTSRAFSKFIHHPAVERTSEIVGSTIARPNAMASGAIFAFVFTLAIYLIANNYGYVLSGAETIVAFIAGWITGQLYDFLRTMITGRH